MTAALHPPASRRAPDLARRRQVAAAIVRNPARSNRAIALELHASPMTVRAVRAELESAGRIPRTRRPGMRDAADFVEDYEFFRDQGITNADIAIRLGIQPASLERRARRHECWRPDRGVA